jgi:uracil-DNA glycosylase
VDERERRYLTQLVELGEKDLVLEGGRRAGDSTQNRRETPSASVALSRQFAGAGPAGAPGATASAAAAALTARPPDAKAGAGAAGGPLPPGLVIEGPPDGGDLFASDPLRALGSLDALVPVIDACRKCPLGHSRQHSVPGEGDPHAGLVVVGEAPGATEDETGRPFVGRAGKLLEDILRAIGLRREEVFICNVLKCRPPENRDPEPLEVAACSPYLHRQLELIRPRLILAMGRPAAHALLGSTASLGDLRGKLHRYRGIPLIVTYHPAALLRNPHWKRPTWDDVRHARRIYDGDRA